MRKLLLMGACACLLAGCATAQRAATDGALGALDIALSSDDPIEDIKSAAPEWACEQAGTIASEAIANSFDIEPRHERGLTALCLLAANAARDRLEISAIVYASPVVRACAELRRPVNDPGVVEVFTAAGC